MDNIYEVLMIPISLDEWTTTLTSMPKDKAAGPSKITYEMIQHLGPVAMSELLDLMNKCLKLGYIPSGSREALLFPIPKPHDFEAKLQNTRPITLFETARKCFVKVLTNRLANILTTHNVLRGGNFAGLPGGSCQIPIHTIDTLINDAKNNKKPLWILSQDISKAFDSINLNMLLLAMKRLKFPQLFCKLILSLFTNRYNKVITCHGETDKYRVQIGIDQGEVISPLLWVIYLDPLLTELNAMVSSPYTYDSLTLSSVYPRAFDKETFEFSNLTFMDDSTLIADSKSGLETLLGITEEFYLLNNTSANHSKYVLASTELISPTDVTFFTRSRTSHTSHSIRIRSLGVSDSFRFLGVWFNLKNSSSFVKTQLKTEYYQFTSLLSHKKLTAKQLVYLHNTVLLPKLSYCSQTTPLHTKTCQQIASPFNLMFKKRMNLPSTFPSVGLHSPNLDLSVTGGQLPLIDLIPSTYILSTSIRSLRSLHLLYLSQLTSSDGTYLLTWKELQHYNIVYAKGRFPHWYTALQQHTCHPRSYRLLPQFVTPAHLSHDLPLPLVTINKKCNRTWAAHWSRISNVVLYGRILASYPTSVTAFLSHWIPSSSNNVELSPSSRQAIFMRCPGCNVGDVLKKKPSKDMIKHSQGASCFKLISLHTTLAMHGCVSKLSKDTDTVLMKTTFHTIESELREFSDRLYRSPDFSRSFNDDNFLRIPTPLPRSLHVAHSLDNDGILTQYR